jgi:hypothetical protein
VKEPRINAHSGLSIEYDRMMALMPRKAIYLFDVRLLDDVYLMTFASRRARFVLRDRGGGTPKNCLPLRCITPAQIFVRKSSQQILWQDFEARLKCF